MPFQNNSQDLTNVADRLRSLRVLVSGIVQDASSDSTQVKTEHLRNLEQTECKVLLAELVYIRTPEAFSLIAQTLDILGDIYHAIGDLERDPQYFTEAAIFFQHHISLSVKSRMHLHNIDLHHHKLAILTTKLFSLCTVDDVATQDAAHISTYKESIVKNTESYRATIEKLRCDTREKLDVMEVHRIGGNNSAYSAESRVLFHNIYCCLKGFLAKVYEDSESELFSAGLRAPCSYAVVSLGSLALSQATPYSDLEFALITANDDYTNSEDRKLRDYFKNLTHLVHLKVIFLGETVIPASKYGIALNHLVNQGIQFDLGGKTPLGRIDGDKPYSLIQTVEGMFKYLINENDKISHIDKHLPFILEQTCFVYGDASLSQKYEMLAAAFLRNVDINTGHAPCEQRAITRLKDGVIEVEYLKAASTTASAGCHVKGHLEEFNPDFSSQREGIVFDVKQEIYRLPDRLIYDLGLYFGIRVDGVIDIVDSLLNMRIINETAANNLRFVIIFANTLRLTTYLHNKGQTDNMSVFAQEEFNRSPTMIKQTSDVFYMSHEGLQEDGVLFKYFYVAIALHEKLTKFVTQIQEIKDPIAFFKDDIFFANSPLNQGLVHLRLSHYQEALNKLQIAIASSNDHKESFKIKRALGDVYAYYDNDEMEVVSYNECIAIVQSDVKNDFAFQEVSIAILLNKIGLSYLYRGQYEEALRYFRRSLDTCEESQAPHVFSARAAAINNLGVTLIYCGDYIQGAEHISNSLKLLSEHKALLTPMVVNIFNNLGLAYHSLGLYEDAATEYKKAMQILYLINRDEPHFLNAKILANLGGLYLERGIYAQAMEYLTKSFTIYSILYKDHKGPEIAGVLSILGKVYVMQSKYAQAQKCFQDSLEIYKGIYKNESHHLMAEILCNIGYVHYCFCEYRIAIELYNQGLSILDTANPIASRKVKYGLLNNIGISYVEIDEYAIALESLEAALGLMQSVYPKGAHQEIGNCLSNIGRLYDRMGNYERAEEYYKRALDMLRNVYGSDLHHDVATVLNNMGMICLHQERYEEAFVNFEEALRISTMVHKGEASKLSAEILGNMGIVYRATDSDDRAYDCYHEALAMQLTLFNCVHESIPTTYKKLARICASKKKYNDAFEYYDKAYCALKMLYHNQNHCDIVYALIDLGYISRKMQNYDQAILHCQDAIRVSETLSGDEQHHGLHISYERLGDVYRSQKRHIEAHSEYEKSLNALKNLYKKPCSEIVDILEKLGSICSYHIRDTTGAIKWYMEQLTALRAIHDGDRHMDVVRVLGDIGNAYCDLEEYCHAIEYYEQKLSILMVLRADYADDSESDVENVTAQTIKDVCNTYIELADQYEQRKAYVNAAQSRKRAIEIAAQLEQEDILKDLQDSMTNLVDFLTTSHASDPGGIAGRALHDVLKILGEGATDNSC